MPEPTPQPGDIVVTGRRKWQQIDLIGWNFYTGYGEIGVPSWLQLQGYPYDGAITPIPVDDHGNGMTVTQAQKTLQALAAVRATLTTILNRYGPGTMLDLDGKLVPIVKVIEGIDRVSGWIEAGVLVWGLATGDLNAIDAIGFVFGVIATAAVAEEVGAGVLAFAIGTAAELAVVGGLKALNRVGAQVIETFHTEVDQFVHNNPVPGYSGTPVEMYRKMMGMPSGGGIPGNYNENN